MGELKCFWLWRHWLGKICQKRIRRWWIFNLDFDDENLDELTAEQIAEIQAEIERNRCAPVTQDEKTKKII